ncbi:MAG: hypothetical protein Q9221_008044 [Calogaya cf. arnoldii]
MDFPAQLLLVLGWLQGLHFLHGHGILHRDIKPSNLGIRLGNPLEAILLDFDGAIVAELSCDCRKGTWAYSSPEFIDLLLYGEINPNITFHGKLNGFTARHDLWALGLSIWYMTGQTLNWLLLGTPEELERVSSIPIQAQVYYNIVTPTRYEGFRKQLYQARSIAKAADNHELVGLLGLCEGMTQYNYRERVHAEDAVTIAKHLIKELKITDGSIEPKGNEKQITPPVKPHGQAAKRVHDALEDQSPNGQGNVSAPAKRQNRARNKGDRS